MSIESAVNTQRVLEPAQIEQLFTSIMAEVHAKWPNLTNLQGSDVQHFVRRNIHFIRELEIAALHHPSHISLDTDVFYIDTGPGPYSFDMLEPGKTDLDDKQYHQNPWSRKMDRARVRAAAVLAVQVTKARMMAADPAQTPKDMLTAEDFEKYGPTIMYTSMPSQNAAMRYAYEIQREAGVWTLPPSKIVMYQDFIDEKGERKEIKHTADQMQALRLPTQANGKPPRRFTILSQAAHFVRLLLALERFSQNIPQETIVQLFPIPTPVDAVMQYAHNEIMGSIRSVLMTESASFKLFQRYVIE